MSKESIVRVTTLTHLRAHPGADRLDIGLADHGYPVITKRGEFCEGATIVYVPVDTMIPLDGPLNWLAPGKTGFHRLKAVRLRGIFSMGLVLAAEPDDELGTDVGARYGMFKWEPPPPKEMYQEPMDEAPALDLDKYDIEGWRRYAADVFADPDEVVVITEKVHGANARFVWHEGRLRLGSRSNWRLIEQANDWARIAHRLELESVCRALGENQVLYGEITGVQDLRYGFTPDDPEFFVFDILDANTGQYWDVDRVRAALPTLRHAAELYRGPLHGADVPSLAEGPSLIREAAGQIREGVVVKPLTERHCDILGGRAILKLQGEGYLTR